MPGLVPGIHALQSHSKTWMAGTSPAMTKSKNQKLLVDQIDIQDRQLEDIRAPSLLDFEEQNRNEFLADINFQRVGLLRPRHDADILIVEFAAKIGVKRRHRLDAWVIADLDDHTKIVGALAVFVIDGHFAKIIRPYKNLGIVLALRHHADLRIAEKFLQIAVEFSDFLDVQRVTPS